MKNKELVEKLITNNLTLISVESLTAGLFSSSICEVPGASKIFKGAFVTYQSSFKTDALNIDSNLINDKGVVSSEVAIEMVKSVKKYNSDLVISFTGNAGPTACEGEAPVGRVYIGLSFKDKYESHSFDFTGDRNSIRQQCVEKGIELLLKKLENFGIL